MGIARSPDRSDAMELHTITIASVRLTAGVGHRDNLQIFGDYMRAAQTLGVSSATRFIGKLANPGSIEAR